MGCGESKNAVATANTISQRKKPNEEATVIDKEGEKESHNGQDLVAQNSENSNPREEGGHGDEEKATKREGNGEIGGDGQEKKEPQGSPHRSLSSSHGIDGTVSENLSGTSEDTTGPKISKVEAESAEKQAPEDTETKNQTEAENKEEEASADIHSKASSPDAEQKEKA